MGSLYKIRLAAHLAKQKSENGTTSTATIGDLHHANEIPRIGFRKATVFQSIVRRHKQRQNRNGGFRERRKRMNTASFRNIVAFQSLVKRVTVQNKSEFSFSTVFRLLLLFLSCFCFFAVLQKDIEQ